MTTFCNDNDLPRRSIFTAHAPDEYAVVFDENLPSMTWLSSTVLLVKFTEFFHEGGEVRVSS